MFIILLLLLVSGVAGLLGGLTGTGGILIPPVLIEWMGMSPHLAMGTAQASFFAPSFLAVWLFRRHGDFDWPAAVPVSLGGLPFAFVGANIKPLVDGSALTLLLALCIVAAGGLMLSPRQPMARAPLEPPRRGFVLFGVGAAVGLLAGITGSGSSAILVPAMLYFRIDVLGTLAACQLYSVLVSMAGTAGNLIYDAIDFMDAFWLALGQIVGISAGVALAQRMETTLLKRCVGIVCVGAGLFLLFKSATALFF